MYNKTNNNSPFITEDFITDSSLDLKLLLKKVFGEEQEYDTDRVLMRYKGESSRVEIPYGVTIIGSFAFCDNFDIETVVIPRTVKRISQDAFLYCLNLKEVIIEGNTLTAIDPNAFAGCSCLKKINFPNSVQYIGDAAFAGCKSLYFVDLPSSLETLGEAAFAGCHNLYTVKFPKSLKTISKYAFMQTLVFYIPDHITEIGDEAFRYNTWDEMFIPVSVKKIGKDAFDINLLQAINYEGTEAQWKSIEIDNTTDWLKKVTMLFNCKRQ